MIRPGNAVSRWGAAFLAATMLLAPAVAAAAEKEEQDTQDVAQARQRIADVAKEMSRLAEEVKKDLGLDQVAEEDVALDLMRYATFRVAGAFFSAWKADKKLARPDKPKCLFEDSPVEGSLVTQIANDEFLISFVQEGHLYEVASGIAEQICQTFGPQIIRPMIRQAEDGLPTGARPPTPTAAP